MMKVLTPAHCLLAVSLAGATLSAQTPWSHTFDLDRPDQPPTAFTLASMRQPGTGRWLVQRQGTHGYLVHAADASASGYALAVSTAPAADDLSLSVRLRFAGGLRTGGMVWRYQNDQNFHALALDLTRNELALYRVMAGNRIRLDVEDDLELDAQAWHTLKVIHEGSDIRVYLGGIRVFEEEDRRGDGGSVPTGRAGLLAGGSSDVSFDDLHFEPRRARR